MNETFDFYNKTSLKSYNLNETMRYQLSRLDTLDVFTRKHSESVANITCRLCEHLKLNPTFTVYCTTCAYLHDIGKMFIPHEILQKNGKLTKEEYEIMKTHAIKGYNICMADPLLQPYANGPLYHHEALNGTGYPNGVTIEKIPLEGQIIRVADEYDAIVNKRQYKSHIGISDTLKILIENATPVPAKPEENLDRKMVKIRKKYGKINKKILAQLFKIVISDIEYEISCIKEYVTYLGEQIKRLENVKNFYDKYKMSMTDNDKRYYAENIKALLSTGETVENFNNILEDYKNAYNIRNDKINNLYNEINIIKHLKI